MTRFQMEYWQDGPWLVGRLVGVPGVFSQGATLGELENNLQDAYRLMMEEQDPLPPAYLVSRKEISFQA